MTDLLAEALDRALAGRRLLDHPFYRRWEAGELARWELSAYASQYRHFEAALPDVLAAIASGTTDPTAREWVTANWRDEVGPPSHLALFDEFAASLSAVPEPPSPAMAALVSTYRELAGASAGEAIAGLLAYEAQGAAIAETKGRGLRDRYDLTNDKTRFWDTHAQLEDDHAAWTFEALRALGVAPALVERAAAAVADGWWSFLDEREALVAA